MFEPYDYAYKIEVTAKAVFNCEKFEIGGIVDANFIEKDPFITIAFILGNYYNKADRTFKEKIDEFLNIYYLEMGKSMKDMGEEKAKKLVGDFNKIVATI